MKKKDSNDHLRLRERGRASSLWPLSQCGTNFTVKQHEKLFAGLEYSLLENSSDGDVGMFAKISKLDFMPVHFPKCPFFGWCDLNPFSLL